ncbi:MAG: PDDEXK nuclease domain-containing protein [Burkholderiales bacterium]|nr:PDDEXK nuclease domain-containing protein [Burkholderiales bacterium]
MTQIINNYSKDFNQIFATITQTRQKVYSQVNHALIQLYWEIGMIISNRVASADWGKGIVSELAKFIIENDPTIKGFSDKNLWRMKQFYETYRDSQILSPLVRELPWTHNMIIFSQCKNTEQQEFYIKLAIKEKYSKRELERQIDSSLYERTILGNRNVSKFLKNLHPAINNTFKDNYVLEFLGLPDIHSEDNLQKALVQNMKKFILELGKDFIFIDEEFRLQVGNSDFFIDLLFFNRQLSALVAFEIKVEKFKPSHIGQLNFYLEALDRDVKKPHESPSIGVLLCSDKDDEVVEYALSRSLSPALIARYSTILPDKKILQKKMHEITEMIVAEQK